MKNTLLLLLLLVCISCKDSIDVKLKDALQTAYENPTLTLSVLDSIQNPEKLSKRNYMGYILARTQTKYLLGMNVTNDTLIFEAKKYLEDKQEGAKACFYAGIVQRQRNIPEKAMQYFLGAEQLAENSNDRYILARSNQMIANLYYDRLVMDSAISRYKKALIYYNNLPGEDKYKLQTLKYLGVAYEIDAKMDSAYFYYNEALQLAINTNNSAYQSEIMQDLGVFYFENKEYGKALEYYRKTLTYDLSTRDSLRLYLNISDVFNEINRIDSARFYTDLIKDRLAHIDDNYVLESMYEALATYNEKAGNFNEALVYTQKKYAIKEKIAENNNDLKFLTAEKLYKYSLKEKDEENLRMRFYILLIIVIAVIFIAYLLVRKKQKEKQLSDKEKLLLEKENESLGFEKAAMKELIENLSFIKDLQQNFINEWVSIEKEVKGLAIRYEATEEPTIFIRIRQMVEDVKAKTNSYLIERGRKIILKHPMGKAALERLNDSDLLVIMLCYFRYDYKGIGALLGLVAHKRNMEYKKLNVRNILVKSGFTLEEANQMIFPVGFDEE